MINQVEKREGEFLQRGQHSAKAQRQVSLCATKESWKRYSVWMENIITQIKSCETRSVNRGQITVLYGINKSFMLGAIRSHWRVLSRGATLDLLFRKMTIATVTYESEGNETRSIKCQNLKLIRKTILPQFWNLGIRVGVRLTSSDWWLVRGLTGPQNGKTNRTSEVSELLLLGFYCLGST